jgi:nicotinamidase-related amidase
VSRVRILPAEPRPFALELAACALLVVDMQHEFLSPGGWIDALGLDVSLLAPAARNVQRGLAAARAAAIAIVHTREGYSSDLADCPAFKRYRADPPPGALGTQGRYMVRGEPGHAIAAPFAPLPDEPVIDKYGAGAFHATDLEVQLRTRGVRQLVVCGVTIDCCVLASLFEANDRGFECLLIGDATGCYDPATTKALLAMLAAGVITSVCGTSDFVQALAYAAPLARNDRG